MHEISAYLYLNVICTTFAHILCAVERYLEDTCSERPVTEAKEQGNNQMSMVFWVVVCKSAMYEQIQLEYKSKRDINHNIQDTKVIGERNWLNLYIVRLHYTFLIQLFVCIGYWLTKCQRRDRKRVYWTLENVHFTSMHLIVVIQYKVMNWHDSFKLIEKSAQLLRSRYNARRS